MPINSAPEQAVIIEKNWYALQQRVDELCKQYQKDMPTILAVSKKMPHAAVEAAFVAGARHFGENYINEAVQKIVQLHHLRSQGLYWHCTGPVQSNKSQMVATHFDWCHTIDRIKIAQRLSDQRPNTLPPLQVCIQINIDQSATKAGIDPNVDSVLALGCAIDNLPGLQLRGLMSIPDACIHVHVQHQRMRRLFDEANAQQVLRLPMDTLSMGMSADMAEAVTERTTLLRIGTAIFGHRALV